MEVRGFTNLADHYQRYISNFSNIVLPLTDLMRSLPQKGSVISWGPEREEATFLALKNACTSEPILCHAHIGVFFIIDLDSSQFTIGAILQQYFLDPDGKWHLHP